MDLNKHFLKDILFSTCHILWLFFNSVTLCRFKQHTSIHCFGQKCQASQPCLVFFIFPIHPVTNMKQFIPFSLFLFTGIEASTYFDKWILSQICSSYGGIDFQCLIFPQDWDERANRPPQQELIWNNAKQIQYNSYFIAIHCHVVIRKKIGLQGSEKNGSMLWRSTIKKKQDL